MAFFTERLHNVLSPKTGLLKKQAHTLTSPGIISSFLLLLSLTSAEESHTEDLSLEV